MFPPFQHSQLIVAVLVAIGWVTGLEPVAAQGLLRRLQDRIQSRVDSATEERGRSQGGADPANTSSGPDKSVSPAGSGSGAAPEGTLRPAVPIGPIDLESGAAALGRAAERFGESILSRPGDGDRPTNRTKLDPPAAAKPSMGIQVVADEGSPGLKVAGIRPGSLAAEAGLRVDDLIVAVDGVPTPTIESIAGILRQRQVGDSLRASVRRGETIASVQIPLVDSRLITKTLPSDDRPDTTPAEPPSVRENDVPKESAPVATIDGDAIDMGVEVTAAEGQRGVVVSGVQRGSSAAAAGLQVGDRIVSIDGRLIRDATSYQQELARRTLGEHLSLNVVRDQILNRFEVVLRPVNPDASADDSLAQQSGKAAAGSDASDRNGGGASVFGGLGSVLGGLFGGSANQPPPAAPSADAASKDGVDSTSDLSGNEKGVNDAGGKDNGGQENAVQPTEEDQQTQSDSQPLRDDPPSVEALKPPVLEIPAGETQELESEKDRIIQTLREEIRMLRQRLEALENGRS